MYVIDELTRKEIDRNEACLILTSYDSLHYYYGYVSNTVTLIPVIIKNNKILTAKSLFKDKLFFDKSIGYYRFKSDYSTEYILKHSNILGRGDFPYTFPKRYEAVNNFCLFKNKQKILNHKKNELAKYLNYSFGLEFETSCGYIPQDICFRDGLIPLRDGSISGIEYSTVVMEGNKGLNLLKQQLKTLSEYTCVDKECSLHIHFGNFPLDENKIFRFYKICEYVEAEIMSNLAPDYAFSTEMFKNTGKNYCKPLPRYSSFEKLYYALVNEHFFGSFTQPHPNDIERIAKWKIPSRYYWVNFINILCYNVNKTIEIRFLSPTFNYNKILSWIFIFNGLLKYAESDLSISPDSILSYLFKIYPDDLKDLITSMYFKLFSLKKNQQLNNDHIGQDFQSEKIIF